MKPKKRVRQLIRTPRSDLPRAFRPERRRRQETTNMNDDAIPRRPANGSTHQGSGTAPRRERANFAGQSPGRSGASGRLLYIPRSLTTAYKNTIPPEQEAKVAR